MAKETARFTLNCRVSFYGFIKYTRSCHLQIAIVYFLLSSLYVFIFLANCPD